MALSGSKDFEPDVAEYVEEAFERCGLELRTGYDLKTARRSFQILTLEWQNRGINLFTIESGTLSLAKKISDSRTLITVSWSLQRAQNGEQPYWMATTLAAMLGQIGLPGGGVGFGYGAIGGVGVSMRNFGGLGLPKGKNMISDL